VARAEDIKMAVVHDQKMTHIDLRSDTVTWPTLEMRVAMANAKVGDDVMGDDLTVNQLEADVAVMLGKEAALFVSSGTQGNLLAILGHCRRGEEVIMGDRSHTFLHETAGVSGVASVMPHCIPVQDDGTLRLTDIESAIRTRDDHHPSTTLVIIENTQNAAGHGIALPVEYMDAVAALAKKRGLKMHIDGARIFNAATALGVDVKDLVKSADSVSFCLSKGLCAPAGSVLCGTREFIAEARRSRKMLGGGLRQAGILAAAGLISIHKMTKRLDKDHKVALQLYEGLKSVPGIKLLSVHTNFVWFELTDPKISTEYLSAKLKENNILLVPEDTSNRYRCAIHYWISEEDVQTIVRAMQQIMQSGDITRPIQVNRAKI